MRLNKNAAGHLRRGMTEQDELSSGNRRDSREPLVDKSTQTDTQKAIAISFVTHRRHYIAKSKERSKQLLIRCTNFVSQSEPLLYMFCMNSSG
jgi:hypothetical protein